MSNYLPLVSRRMKRVISRSRSELTPKAMTEMIQTLTVQNFSLAEDELKLLCSSRMLQKLPQSQLKQMLQLIVEMELHPLKALRLNRRSYVRPTCYSVLNYAAVRGHRRVIERCGKLVYLDEYEPILDVITIL